MNYNNFSCRLAVPRLATNVAAEIPPKSSPKKERKSVRRRSVAIASAALLLMLAAGGTGAAAMDAPEVSLRFIPAPEKVAFKGATGHLALDALVEPLPEESDFTAQLDAFTAQVHALTTKSFPTVPPAQAMPWSVLTGILLGLGLTVAVTRAGLLFRADLIC